MRSWEKSWLLAAVLLVAAMLPSVSNGQDSASNLWEQVPSDILELIPQDLRSVPTKPPASDDVRKSIVEMLKQVQEGSPEVEKALIARDGEEFSEKNRQILARYVEKNSAALETLRTTPMDSLIRIRNQRDATDLSLLLFEFMNLGLLDTEFRADEGEYEESARRLSKLMQFAAFLYRSEAESGFHYGAGRWHSQFVRQASRMASSEDIPHHVAVSMVRSAEASMLGCENSIPSIQRSFEICTLPILAGMPAEDSVSELIDRQVRIWGPKSLKIPGFDLEHELKERARLIRSLLKGHPNPFDRDETVSLILDQYRQAIGIALGQPISAYSPTPPEFVAEIECWPAGLSLHPIGTLRLVLAGKQEVPSREELENARNELAAVSNALGKHLASIHEPRDLPLLAATYSATSRCAVVALAARAYHQQFGQLPDDLQGLVDAKLLSRVPADPFGGELRYSRKRRIVWCVGRNGRDDGGRRSDEVESWRLVRIMAPSELDVPEDGDRQPPAWDDWVEEILLPKADSAISGN